MVSPPLGAALPWGCFAMGLLATCRSSLLRAVRWGRTAPAVMRAELEKVVVALEVSPSGVLRPHSTLLSCGPTAALCSRDTRGGI